MGAAVWRYGMTVAQISLEAPVKISPVNKPLLNESNS